MDVRSFIDDFAVPEGDSGPLVLAGRLTQLTGEDVSAGTVYRWRDRNTISHRWRPHVLRIAKQDGREVPSELEQFARIVGDGAAA